MPAKKKSASKVASLKQKMIHAIINHFIKPDLLYVFKQHFKYDQVNLMYTSTMLDMNDKMYVYHNLDKLTTEQAQSLLDMLNYIENRMPVVEKEIRTQFEETNPTNRILLNYHLIQNDSEVDKRLSTISKEEIINIPLPDNREAIIVNHGGAEFHDFMLFKIVPVGR